MTYQQRPVCRRGGCVRPVSEEPAGCEGDLGWCDIHRSENQRVRLRLAAVPASRVRPEQIYQRSA